MEEEDLELLVTLDDAGEGDVQEEDGQEEDTFNHLQADDPYKVEFGQGDWTCTVGRFSGIFTGTTNDSMKGRDGSITQPTNKTLEIEVCRVTRWKNGEIIEQRVFYDLVGMQQQIGIM